MLLYMESILESVNEAAMIAWRFMENLKCQASELVWLFFYGGKKLLGNAEGKLYNYSCMEAPCRMDWRGSETEGREGYSKSADESLNGGCGRGQAESITGIRLTKM